MNKIKIKVAYLSPKAERILDVEITATTTIEQAIKFSGILMLFPKIDLCQQRVGIFGKLRKLTDVPQANDRIEIYRPLMIDPKEARRLKAKIKTNV